MSKNLRVTVQTLIKGKNKGSKKRTHEQNVMKAIRTEIKEMVLNGIITKEFADENKDELIRLVLEKLESNSKSNKK